MRRSGPLLPARELKTFEQNLLYARDMAATAVSMSKITASAMDLSDLFRAAFVQGVSAFDHYVHDEVRVRMLDIFTQPSHTWPPAFATFTIPLSAMSTAASGAGNAHSASWLENEIRTQHQVLSFQHPDKVAQACRLVSTVDLWAAIASQLGITRQGRVQANKVAKNRLKLIIDRRNLIVHEADLDPTPPRNNRYSIDQQLTEDSLQFLDDVVHTIHVIL